MEDERPVSGAGVVHYQLLHRPRSVPTALGPAPLVTGVYWYVMDSIGGMLNPIGNMTKTHHKKEFCNGFTGILMETIEHSVMVSIGLLLFFLAGFPRFGIGGGISYCRFVASCHFRLAVH